MFLGKHVRHPERDSAGAFDLHQYLPFRKQRRAIHFGFQGNVFLAAEHCIVKGYTEV